MWRRHPAPNRPPRAPARGTSGSGSVCSRCGSAPAGWSPGQSSFQEMEPLETVVRPRLPVDVVRSLAALKHGPRDPSVRIRSGVVWRATRTPLGDATVSYEALDASVLVRAWGPGAQWCLDTAPDVLGARDSLDGWEPSL